MAKIEKYSTGIVGVIKHNIREFKDGKCPTNMEVDPARIGDNYSIIRRGETAKDIEKYRKQIEKECFHYNRKNIVHCNEVICSLPTDCPPEQERQFFEESYKYICSTIPMGKRAVFLAEVHVDEGRILKDGVTVVEGAKHLHVMYVPAVKDLKHDGYDFRLCSDELTKRAVLKQWHPKYQKSLDDAGVQATVASGVTSGKGISVKSLKEITKETGLSLDQIKELQNEKTQSLNFQKEIVELQQALHQKDATISDLQCKIEENNIEKFKLQSTIKDFENSNEQLKKELHELHQKFDDIEHTKREYIQEISNAQKDNSWGASHTWGSTEKIYQEDKEW